MVHHFRLVGDAVKTDIRRQCLHGLCQLLVHLVTECDDVITGHHLQIQNQTRSSVIGDILLRFLIAALYRSHIFQSHHTTGERVGPDDLLLYLIFRLIRQHDLHCTLRIVLSANGTQPLHSQLCLQRVEVDAVH